MIPWTLIAPWVLKRLRKWWPYILLVAIIGGGYVGCWYERGQLRRCQDKLEKCRAKNAAWEKAETEWKDAVAARDATIDRLRGDVALANAATVAAEHVGTTWERRYAALRREMPPAPATPAEDAITATDPATAAQQAAAWLLEVLP